MLKDFFKNLNGVLVGGLTVVVILVLSFLWWVFDFDYMVPLWIVCIIVIVAYIICIIIYGIFSLKKEVKIYRLPKVIKIVKAKKSIIFIVEKNELFNQGSYATVCYQEDDEDIETVIGLGYVETINNKGYLQIKIEKKVNKKEVDDIFKKIEDKKHIKQTIKIKPSIHKNLFEEVA